MTAEREELKLETELEQAVAEANISQLLIGIPNRTARALNDTRRILIYCQLFSDIMMIRLRRQMRRPRRRCSQLQQIPLTIAAGIFLLCLHLIPLPVRRGATTHSEPLPWPCLFASASSITHRVASSISQSSSSSSSFLAESTLSSSSRELISTRELQNNNNANAAKSDDSIDYSWMEGVNFNEVSIMPVSCVNYHNGHMIKFQYFEKTSSLNCHFKNLGTFVVSIAHYMRAYFNYQALTYGNDFMLPGDVGFLNCVMLKETAKSENPLYAKIGCQHRGTYTSTKLQLIVYTDKQCSKVYGGENNELNSDGYDLNGYFLSNKVSFRPPFYSCQSCLPEEISNSFSKRYSAWYDDDYISTTGQKRVYSNNNNNNNEENDAEGGGGDDATQQGDDDNANNYYNTNDDTYNYASAVNDDASSSNNDDAAATDDAAADDANANANNHYVNTDDAVYYNYKAHDDDFYALSDDQRKKRGLRKLSDEVTTQLDASHSLTAKETLEEYESDFQQEMALIHRQLEDNSSSENSGSSVLYWNMCQRVYKYGMWCNDACQALDTFRVDEWSRSDVFLLVIMCVFMSAMMLLAFAKRVKAYERAAMWGDEPGAPSPGLPPCAMLMLFGIVFMVIVVLAALKFVNETLVFSVVSCVLLFLYMLKLTLFESRKQVFVPARSTVRSRSLKEPFY